MHDFKWRNEREILTTKWPRIRWHLFFRNRYCGLKGGGAPFREAAKKRLLAKFALCVFPHYRLFIMTSTTAGFFLVFLLALPQLT